MPSALEAARRKPELTDARGRRVTALDPLALHLRRDHDAIDAAALRVIVEEIGPGIDRWPRRALWVGIVGMAIALSVLAVRLGLTFARSGTISLHYLSGRLPVVIAVATGLWFQWFLARQARSRRVLAVLLRHARCPHCGYDLRGLTPEHDRVVVCPECGCAWALGKGATAAATRPTPPPDSVDRSAPPSPSSEGGSR